MVGYQPLLVHTQHEVLTEQMKALSDSQHLYLSGNLERNFPQQPAIDKGKPVLEAA